MATELIGKNKLTHVNLQKIGLCDRPAVPEALHVLMKSRDSDTEEVRRDVDPDRRKAGEDTLAKAETFLMGLASIIKNLAGRGETATTESENDMDLSKATEADILKANPELHAAIVAKALEALKDKNGSRVGDVDVSSTVDEKDGKRVAGAKVAGVTDAAVDEKLSTTKEPLAEQNNGGADLSKAVEALQKGMGELAATLTKMCEKVEKFDTSRPGEAEKAKEEKAAVKATQAATDHTDESNGGVAKIDTSRPGESAIAGKEKAAVKATQESVDATAAAGDSGIGGQAGDEDEDKKADAARKAELATLKEQVATLTKALEASKAGAERLANVEKAISKIIRDGESKPETVQKSAGAEVVQKAGSKQAGQLDEAGAREATQLRKTHFDSAIHTIALSKTVRQEDR